MGSLITTVNLSPEGEGRPGGVRAWREASLVSRSNQAKPSQVKSLDHQVKPQAKPSQVKSSTSLSLGVSPIHSY